MSKRKRKLIFEIKLSCDNEDKAERTQTILITNISKVVHDTVKKKNGSMFEDSNKIEWLYNVKIEED